jgi:hypothetical protein
VCQKAKSPVNENLAALIKLTATMAGQIHEATNCHFQVRTYTLLSQRPDFLKNQFLKFPFCHSGKVEKWRNEHG